MADPTDMLSRFDEYDGFPTEEPVFSCQECGVAISIADRDRYDSQCEQCYYTVDDD